MIRQGRSKLDSGLADHYTPLNIQEVEASGLRIATGQRVTPAGAFVVWPDAPHIIRNSGHGKDAAHV